MSSVLIVGCGLIGASVGLALRDAGWDVLLEDAAPQVVGEAVRRGAGKPWEAGANVDLALIAVPPRVTAAVLAATQNRDVAQTYTHVSSVQSHVQREVEALSTDPSVIVGGHPLAGRELSGPAAATSDLFAGRPWAICPGAGTAPAAVDALRALIRDVGADAVELSAAAHDASVALLSHLPQVAASALAAGLLGAGLEDGSRLRLAGPGLVDTTRLAGSDSGLWEQILELNAPQVAPVLTELAARLTAVASALTALGGDPAPAEAAAAVSVVRSLLRDGNDGRALVPVKRGVRSEAFAPVRVTVSDEPGRLAALLLEAGGAGVNVEDVHVEHIPGRPTGIIELAVAVPDVPRLSAALRDAGWAVADQA